MKQRVGCVSVQREFGAEGNTRLRDDAPRDLRDGNCLTW